jgi:predicted DNA repair protein MutK
VLATVGVAAMLWVGGHILLVGADELGLHTPYALVHHLEEVVHAATGPLGGLLGWLTNTAASAVVGLVVGAIVVALLHLIPAARRRTPRRTERLTAPGGACRTP